MNDIIELNGTQIQSFLKENVGAGNSLELISTNIRKLFEKEPLYLFLRKDPEDGSKMLCLFIRKADFSSEENESLINNICNTLPENFLVKFIYSDPSAA